jgi:hypothetical protein
MWLCAACGLAQLIADPTVPEEPRGAEPTALVAQAEDAVRRVTAAGLAGPGQRVAEYGSPHGGSWLPLLTGRGLTAVGDGEPADVVLDCFGLMHAADQAAAMAARAARVAPGGVLLLQFHSLEAIITGGQWNALRHGHYAYYSTTALISMLARAGFSPRTAWRFGLYGGTVLLAARHDADDANGADSAGGAVNDLLASEAHAGVTDPAVLRSLGDSALARANVLHDWLAAENAAGRRVLGYGAASRAVALLRRSGVDRRLLPGVADASPGKQGLRMPGTDIPVISPGQLVQEKPPAVVVFLSDLLPEVRQAYPEIETAGGRWVDADSLACPAAGSGGLQQDT